MSQAFKIENTNRVKTAFKDFYNDIKQEGFVKYQHQLFTYAFLVGLIEEEKNIEPKNHGICQIHNINDENFEMIKGIALMKIDVDNGKELFEEMLAYADGGIEKLKAKYRRDKTIINLDEYIE